MTPAQEIIKKADDHMKKTIDTVRTELAHIRTGKATTALLDGIRVDYHGTPTPLAKLAQVAAPEVRLLTIQPWEKSMVQAIEKAIMKSDLGLTPQSDGMLIRLPIPALTEERRREFAKLCKKHAEEGKVAIRNIRRDGVDHLKKAEKAGTLTQDDNKRGDKELQNLTDKAVAELDRVLAAKEKEVMEV